MRAESISITDHALLRWNERVSVRATSHVSEIEEAVKNAKIIKKNEIIPYVTSRKENTTYAFDGEILYVLESISIDHYRLITVITDSSQSSEREVGYEPEETNNVIPEIIPGEPIFKSRAAENNWLLIQKRQTESRLSKLTKSSPDRKDLIAILSKIEDRIFKNKITKEEKTDYISLPVLQPVQPPPRDFAKDINNIFEQLALLHIKIDKLLKDKEDISVMGKANSEFQFNLTN